MATVIAKSLTYTNSIKLDASSGILIDKMPATLFYPARSRKVEVRRIT
jgi:hypothetical protein